MAAISITNNRSKTGTFTLPYFSSFTGGAPPTWRRMKRAGMMYFDSPPYYNPSPDPLNSGVSPQTIVQTGDFSTLTASGSKFFSGLGVTFTWSFTLTPVDNDNGTVTYTCALSLTASSGVITNAKLVALGGSPLSMANGDAAVVSYLHTLPSQYDNGFYDIDFFWNGSHAGTLGLFSKIYYARAPGHQHFADPYSFLFSRWCYNPPGLNTEIMAGYAGFDRPTDSTSMYCWPPTVTGGVASCPYRYVEWQATATSLTIGTTYHATYQFEWRPLAGGAWSTSSISPFTVNFVAGATSQVLQWITATHFIMNTGRSGAGFAVEYRLKTVTIS